MPISKPTIPNKKGYAIKEDPITKEQYYEKIPYGYSKEVIEISNSRYFTIPEAKNNLFTIKLVGGGASYKNTVNGANGDIIIKDLTLNTGDMVYINIGMAGEMEGNGGTTSFGTYFNSLGGVNTGIDENLNNDNEDVDIEHDEYNYGNGGTIDREPQNGVCIITYEKPIYND